MKKILIITAFVLLVVSCKKESTIREAYNPPQPKLYGTWKMENNSTNGNAFYYDFTDDGSNYAHYLVMDNNGFKTKESYAYKATDKQLTMNYFIYNYEVVADTLILYSSPVAYTRYFRVRNPNISSSNWTGTLKVLKRLELPRAVTSSTIRPFGIDGDYLYLVGDNGMGSYVYKFNTLNNQYSDSLPINYGSTTCFKSPNLYFASEYGNKIFKTNGMSSPFTLISANDIDYTRALSFNASSGAVYAFTQSGQLYSGTEGSTFNPLFDFYTYYLNYLVYYKNDEFMALKSGMLIRLKIAPAFYIVRCYEPLPNFNTYVFSSNGEDTWLFGFNNTTSTYELLKVSLN